MCTFHPVYTGADQALLTDIDDTYAVVALTALTTATVPLTVDALADALDWPLARAHAALSHAKAHPHLAGPLALRRIPPDTYTLKPRLDVLTKEQHRAVTDTGVEESADSRWR
jgi:hypothetical protein